jgi:predicted transcriptional regulator YdeE
MLKIGDFSKLAQVSVKTLRYYGRLGLLKPAWIDRFTGYRYYTIDQLSQLNRILALKDLGFSLEQIAQVLQDDLSPEELRGMLRLKYAEIERLIETEQARLGRVSHRLTQIEREGEILTYAVVLKTVPAQRVVGARDVVPSYSAVQTLFEELDSHLRAHNASLAPPRIAIYYDPEYREQGVDVEAAALLSRRVPETRRVTVHDLPGFDGVASAVHRGSFEALPEAYRALMGWIETNGYRVAGPNRDVYLRGPESDLSPDEYVTEVQFPVKKKPLSTLVIQYKERDEMEPKIVTEPTFTVVGMKYHGKNENNEIAQMWGEFNPRIPEIPHQIGPAYGVCGAGDADGTFDYVAGIGVSHVDEIPEGMTVWEVPGQAYAVFPCTLKTIGEAYEYAFQTWLPGSAYQRADGPDFELYNEEFDLEAEDPKLYIYIPIK